MSLAAFIAFQRTSTTASHLIVRTAARFGGWVSFFGVVVMPAYRERYVRCSPSESCGSCGCCRARYSFRPELGPVEVGVGSQDVLERGPPDGADGFDDRGVPVDRTERGFGLILHSELYELGHIVAEEALHEVDAAVDPGGDACGRQVLVVFDPAGSYHLDAEVREDVGVRPVGRGSASLEEAGCGEDDGAGAHGHDDLGVCAGFGDVVDERPVTRGSQRGIAPAGHDDGER